MQGLRKTKDFLSPASLEAAGFTEEAQEGKDKSLALRVIYFWSSLRTLRALRETKDFFSRPLRSGPQSSQGKQKKAKI